MSNLPNNEPRRATPEKLEREIGLVSLELMQGDPKAMIRASWDAEIGFTPSPTMAQKIEFIRYGTPLPEPEADHDPTEPPESPNR